MDLFTCHCGSVLDNHRDYQFLLSVIHTFVLWSHYGILSVSRDWLWYRKLLVSVTSNTFMILRLADKNMIVKFEVSDNILYHNSSYLTLFLYYKYSDKDCLHLHYCHYSICILFAYLEDDLIVYHLHRNSRSLRPCSIWQRKIFGRWKL